jgi:hypothetical protein
MAGFKVGDRVIFLNEKGGGVITKIVSDQIVHVSDNDGFEIPYAVKDLLKTGTNESDNHSAGSGRASEAEENPDITPIYHVPNKADQRPAGVYMALIPTDQENMLKSPLDIYIINHSVYQILFNIFLNRSGTWHGLEFGYIEPASKLFLKTIERTDIHDWANGLAQLLFYMEGKASPLMPASITINFKPVKVYKEDAFQYEGLLRKHSMVIELTTTEKQAQYLRDEPLDKESIKIIQEKISRGVNKPESLQKTESFLDKHKVDDKIAEVDLHIGELTDDTRKLSNVDMLKMQMAYFEKCMEHAGIEKLSKIIFIHGVGNGTLKNEILRFLRQTEGIDFYDAPYARYGMGATEVLFYKHVL